MPTTYSETLVAKRLVALFAAMEVNRATVADMIGLDRSSMSKILNGQKMLKPADAIKICNLYGVDLEFIYRGRLREISPSLSKKIMAHLTD